MTDLVADDFSLTDAGIRQRVIAVDADSVPVDLSIVVQTGARFHHTRIEDFQAEVRAAMRLLHPADRIRIVTFGEDIREILPWSFRRDPPAVVTAPDLCHDLYDAVSSALMVPPEPGRQHVVLIVAVHEGAGNVLTSRTALEIARRSPTRVHVLVPRVSPGDTVWENWTRWPTCASPADDWSVDRQDRLRMIANKRSTTDQLDQLLADQRRRLVQLAEITGGGEIKESLLTGSIAGPVQALLDDVRSGYVLYYTPTGVPETGWHPIAVTINRPGRYDVRARPGYER